MISGEKELRKAFEDVTTRNVNAAISHSNQTRELVRTLEQNIVNLQNMVMSRDNDINLLKKHLAVIQTIVFSGGTTS